METKPVVAVLSALSQESRLAIFRHLVEIGPQGAVAGAIAGALNLAPATLSFHLKELSHADLVVSQQEGRFIRYAANFATMNDLIAYLTENCCAGAPCGIASCVPTQPKRKRAVTKIVRTRVRATRARGDRR